MIVHKIRLNKLIFGANPLLFSIKDFFVLVKLLEIIFFLFFGKNLFIIITLLAWGIIIIIFRLYAKFTVQSIVIFKYIFSNCTLWTKRLVSLIFYSITPASFSIQLYQSFTRRIFYLQYSWCFSNAHSIIYW